MAAKVEEADHRLLVLEVKESPTYRVGSFVLVDFDSNWYFQGDSMDSVEPGDMVKWVHLVPGDSMGFESGWQFYLAPKG